MENQLPFWLPFLLTLFAGLSTGIGGALVFFTSKTNHKVLSISLGFSAGVMIYISFVELLAEGQEALVHIYPGSAGLWLSLLAFFGGMFVTLIIDKMVPEAENPHEIRELDEESKKNAGLYRVGIMSAIAIAFHNFPEGIATFVSGMQSLELGIPIAIAVAIHNIPEGISVAVPVFYATGDRRKAFRFSFLSGLAEPLGAVIIYFVFRLLKIQSMDLFFGFILCFVAGIMVFISVDELLPGAEKYGEHHLSIYGLIAGMAIMAVSLLLF